MEIIIGASGAVGRRAPDVCLEKRSAIAQLNFNHISVSRVTVSTVGMQ